MSAVSEVCIQVLDALSTWDHLPQFKYGRWRVLFGSLFSFSLLIRLAGIPRISLVHSDL